MSKVDEEALTQAKELLGALRNAIEIVNLAFEAWDGDRDMRCGKILRYLSDPTLRGYRADIDAIHEAVKKAERLL